MKILFVVSEAVPFAKTGGLADVAGALPQALAQLGHEVRLIMPRYRMVGVKKFHLRKILDRLAVTVGTTSAQIAVFQSTLPKTSIPPPSSVRWKRTAARSAALASGEEPGGGTITTYFVDAPTWFDRDGLYQDKGADFPDNLERFSGFVQAVLTAIPKLGWTPDIVHCHDWQTALLCPHLALNRPGEPFWQSVGTVLTVHNLAYQGLFPAEAWPLTNLPAQAYDIAGLEFYGQVNCLKGGLVYADALTTVSPTYAKEMQTPEFGCGLEGVLVSRRDDLVGILNGIDPEEWNPKTDAHLPARYGPEELAGKSLCKLALQRSQGLAEHHVLLIGMIQRLAEQKGIDLFVQAAPELMRLPIQVVILGTGDAIYHETLTALAKQFPEQLALNLTFDNALAHQIEAGADAFLMPSRFEPCGLNQMYSMRYGAVPIVRRVGGLADTVTDVAPSTREARTATGFVFEPYSAQALLETVKRAVAAYQDHGLWEQLVHTGMRQDWSWDRSAREYLRVYERALAKHPVDDRHRHPQSLAR